MEHIPASMDKHLDVLKMHESGGLLVGASSLTGRYWLGSLWYYTNPDRAPDVEKCTAGVQLEAGLRDASWVDAQRVLVGLDTGGVAVWELQGEMFNMISSACEHDDMTASISVSSDMSQFVSGSYDQSIKIWNSDLTSLYTYKAHTDIVWDVQCHPTEPSLFLSCSQDGKSILWDSRDSKPATLLAKGSSGFMPTCVAWKPSAHDVYAMGDEGGYIFVRDLRMEGSTQESVTYQPHNRFVTRLAFSPERSGLLASVSEDCRTAVASISASSASLLYQSSRHSDCVCGLTWGSGDTLLTSGWDARILQHSVSATAVNGDEAITVNGDIGEPELSISVS